MGRYSLYLLICLASLNGSMTMCRGVSSEYCVSLYLHRISWLRNCARSAGCLRQMTDGSRLGSCVVKIIEPPAIKCALSEIRKVLIGFSIQNFSNIQFLSQQVDKNLRIASVFRFYRNSVNIQSSRVRLHAVSRTTVQHFSVTED